MIHDTNCCIEGMYIHVKWCEEESSWVVLAQWLPHQMEMFTDAQDTVSVVCYQWDDIEASVHRALRRARAKFEEFNRAEDKSRRRHPTTR
jgi:hypothetical protein